MRAQNCRKAKPEPLFRPVRRLHKQGGHSIGFTDKAVVIRNLGAIGQQCYERGLGASRSPLAPNPYRYPRPGGTMSNDQKDDGLDLVQWIEVERVPDGGILTGIVGEDRVFVWRNGNRFKAHNTDCPHLGGPLNKGSVVGAIIRCPWHHACFDLGTGEATAAPAFDALLEYPVEFDNDRF